MRPDDIDNMYREAILELARNPLNKKHLTAPDATYKEYNASCGDEIEIQIAFDGSTIVDIGHQGHGCAISQAAVSLVTDDVRGKAKEEAKKITDEDLYQLLGFTPIYTRQKCALLGLHAIQKALH